MVPQRLVDARQRIELLSTRDHGRHAGEFTHEPFHEIQLLHDRPTTVALLPERPRIQPHGKRFGKVFIRMVFVSAFSNSPRYLP